MFFMIGMFSINTTCARESSIQSNDEGRNEKTGCPTKGSSNIWEKSEVNQQGKQPTKGVGNLTIGENQKPQGKAKDQPKTEAAQASKTQVKKNWAGRPN